MLVCPHFPLNIAGTVSQKSAVRGLGSTTSAGARCIGAPFHQESSMVSRSTESAHKRCQDGQSEGAKGGRRNGSCSSSSGGAWGDEAISADAKQKTATSPRRQGGAARAALQAGNKVRIVGRNRQPLRGPGWMDAIRVPLGAAHRHPRGVQTRYALVITTRAAGLRRRHPSAAAIGTRGRHFSRCKHPTAYSKAEKPWGRCLLENTGVLTPFPGADHCSRLPKCWF